MANIELMTTLQAKVKGFMSIPYDIQTIERVPTKLDATFGEKASSIDAACLFIDIRNSSGLLAKNQPSAVANLLKAFHYICLKTIKESCGEVRSFNGDSCLAIFTEKSGCDNAVSSAFAIKYYLNLLLKGKYPIATNFDYGIGIDYGKIFVVKVGYSGEFNNDLIWIGKPINNASKLGNKAKAPYNVFITDNIINELSDGNRFKASLSRSSKITCVPNVLRPSIWKRGIPSAQALFIAPLATPSLNTILGAVQAPNPQKPISLIFHTNFERPL